MRLSLITKLTIATGVILLFFMALFAYMNVATIKSILLTSAISDADKLSETIIKSTHYEMLEDNRKRVYEMMEEVGTLHGVEHIRMINKSGFITFSTKKEEIGQYLDKNEVGCSMCHTGREVKVHVPMMNRSRIFTDRSGKKVVGLAKAIYNEKSCYTAPCHYHPAKQNILGVLDIIVSLEEMESFLSYFRHKIGILIVILIVIIASVITYFTHRLVNVPVRNLLAHTRKISSGNFDSYVPYSSNDEMGDLTDAFNKMSQSLKSARQELEEWGKNLERKVEERTREIKEIQNQLIRTEKLASLGQLVAGIAHEINNPLTGILMFANLVNKNPKLHDEIRSDINVIIAEANRCAKIIKGLLDFSRESIPQKKPSSLNVIMDDTLELVIHQAGFHNIKVSKDYAQDLPLINVDVNQIGQVILNMLINASQAMPGGGKIDIKTYAKDGYACLQISDTGIGIPEEHIDKIFDPFFTTKSSGTGMGLSVSYGIIERHGGKIEVQSKLGEGTTFIIKLPLS